MQPLPEIQAQFAAAILTGDASGLEAVLTSPILSVADVVSIHANNFRLTLSAALAANFRAVQALVGDDCFAALATRYVRQNPPTAPVLAEYGAGFADFLAHQPELRALPYLPDVARLDWAWNVAFHSAEAVPLTAADLPDLLARDGDPDLRLHPSARLLQSPFPVHRIWSMARYPEQFSGEIDLNAGPDHLLILRPREAVVLIPVDPGTYTLLVALADGRGLTAGLHAAVGLSPSFSLESAFGSLIPQGVFYAPPNPIDPNPTERTVR